MVQHKHHKLIQINLPVMKMNIEAGILKAQPVYHKIKLLKFYQMGFRLTAIFVQMDLSGYNRHHSLRDTRNGEEKERTVWDIKLEIPFISYLNLKIHC